MPIPDSAAGARARDPRRRAAEWFVLLGGLAIAVWSGILAFVWYGPYGERLNDDPRVDRIYDEHGQLREIGFDTDGDLRLDRWAFFKNNDVIRMDADTTGDGIADRRQD